MPVSLQGKTAIVTGASSGIGIVTAAELARTGAHVVMVCRQGAKSEAALNEVVKASGSASVELLTADLSSQASVRGCAGAFKNAHDRLDVLVNNAGIFSSDYQVTIDGFERTFATNHLAYFLLTNLVLDVLKKSAPARVVSVASEAERWGKIDFDDLQSQRRYSGMKAYSQSKLANILFTYELARRLEGTGVTANCVHPGLVRSGWGRSAKGLFKAGLTLATPFMVSPEEGAKTSVFVATSPEVEGVTGKYFIKCKPARSIDISYDAALTARLWETSERLTGIS